ncbi:MAG: nickel pincer cofactor biosynthesis protein LarC [Thermoprotei archaeon]|nr:MAG: nickel pincer cofactor biosynthesis protein LarC [Thermoprotei archaeon]
MKVLVLDPRLAGVSGDMLLSSLVDLGGQVDELYHLVDVMLQVFRGCEAELEVFDVERRGLRAKRVELKVYRDYGGASPLDFRGYVEELARKAELSSEARGLALRALDELIDAESSVHGVPRENLRLHELLSLDTALDLVGAALLLDRLDVFKDARIYTTPPAVGGGVVECSHGALPVPAPATLEILRRHRFKVSSVDVEAELTTPTGAALLVSLAEEVVDVYPPMTIERVGYGAGRRDLGSTPNVMRVVYGSRHEASGDRVVVLETNVDDVPGELLGYLVDKLLRSGALDVAIIPAVGKKSRPISIVRVVSDPATCMSIAELLMEEAGTLGVRLLETPRITAEREVKEVDVEVCGRRFKVSIKVSRVKGKVLNVKAEYEDLKRISEELGMPLRRVAKIVDDAVKRLGLKGVDG